MTDYTEDDLFNAFVAGFMQSAEGQNAEYPHSFDEDRIREALGEPFYRWNSNYREDDDGEEVPQGYIKIHDATPEQLEEIKRRLKEQLNDE